MAPEVIRNETQTEKLDTWSYGVLLWEMMFCLAPFPGLDDPTMIMWGVGSETLALPIPDDAPSGLRLLLLQCWACKPRNRPSFRNILIHLDIAAPDALQLQEDTYYAMQRRWQSEVTEQLALTVSQSRAERSSPSVRRAQEVAAQERRDQELMHARDIREHYEHKLRRTNNLYLEMTTCVLQLERRERELIK